MKLNTFLLLFCFGVCACAQNVSKKVEQIGGAVQALPEEHRAEATVYGFDTQGNMLTLRSGTNSFIAIADDPTKEGFSVAAYHKDLEPFMARGRELKAEGKNPKEIFDIREEEAKSGALKMPENPATLYVFSGSKGKYDAVNDTVTDAQYRYVVYIPFATAESTGLPTKPMKPGGPWIMDPGTHRAHIMISQP